MSDTTDEQSEQQVARYRQERPLYQSFSDKLRTLLESLLDADGIKYQVVEARAKDIESFREKVSRPGKSYVNPLDEITDLCGARIIVYYEDDVEKVAEIVDREFSVIETETSHRAESLDADRFGYLSFHSIITLDNRRSGLSEWKGALGLKAEIQIRTVIQHAWSAVSHLLQYKQQTAIASKLQRRLFRIAGLFELADAEFVGIRDARERVSEYASAQISSGNKEIIISLESIQALIETSGKVASLVNQGKAAGFSVSQNVGESSAYPEIYDIAKKLKIRKIIDLENVIPDDCQEYFSQLYIEEAGKSWSVSQEFFVFFALLRRVGDLFSPEKLEEYDWDIDRAESILQLAEKFKVL